MSIRIKEIPQFVFDELHALIGEKTKEKLFKYVLGDCLDPKASLDLYIRNIMDTVFVNDEEEADLLAVKDSYRNKRQTTKKNWLRQLQKEIDEGKDTPIHQEFEMLQKLSETETALNDVINIGNQEQYIQNKLKQIAEWASDRNTRLLDYPYLRTKQKYQLERAAENDVVHIIWDFLKVQPMKNWISIRSEDMVENPIFTDGIKKMKNVIYDDGTAIAYDDYKLSDNRVLRLLISAKDDDEVRLDKTFMLDEIDSEILELAMQQRNDRFIKEKVIMFDLYPLVERIYGNSKKGYDLIENRLLRFHRFSIEGRTSGKETKTTFAYNLFESVKVIRDVATGRVFAEMKFSDTLHQQLITDQTVKIYSHLIHRLENKLSKILIYAFQKERLDAYLLDRDVKSHFEYSFFTNRIRFRSKKIESNVKQITDSLQEFKDANILIKDFKRVGNGFNISLTPLSESEKADFFSGPTSPAILKVARGTSTEILETAVVSHF